MKSDWENQKKKLEQMLRDARATGDSIAVAALRAEIKMCETGARIAEAQEKAARERGIK